MTDQLMPPVTPDPDYTSIVLGLVRGVVQIFAGLGFGWATFVSGSQEEMFAFAIVSLATLGWSTWQKLQAKRKLHDTAVASAVAGVPTQPLKT